MDWIFEQNNIDIVQGQGYDVSSEEGAEYVEAYRREQLLFLSNQPVKINISR